MHTIPAHHDATVTIDGQEITLQITRFSRLQRDAYNRNFARIQKIQREQRAFYAIDWSALSDEELERRMKVEERQDAMISTFYTEVIEAYITVARPGPTLNGEEICDGAGLLRAYGGSPTVVEALVLLVGMKNEVSDSEKKAWGSLFGSAPSSNGSNEAAAGTTPAPTADGAEPLATATNGDAMA